MKKLKILGYDYVVKFSPSSDDGGMHDAGRCNATKQIIIVDKETHKQCQESTVLHEILEALQYHLELGLEHRIIASLESGLYQVLTDNGVDLSQLTKGL